MNPLLDGQSPVIGGYCDAAFSTVADAFEQAFYERGEEGDIGAACAVVVDGELVVDLWGGFADVVQGQPWQANTLTCCFSASKGVCALLSLMLVDRGIIELDSPVASYWPEFARNGKDAIRVRDVLEHSAALSWLNPDLKPGDTLSWHTMVRAIEDTTPNGPVGFMPGYLNQTFGYVLGELCRRVNGGRRWAKFLGDEIANPFGIDWLFCVPVSEVGRLATIYSNKPDKVPETESAGSTPFGLSMKGTDPGQDYNSHAWRSAEQGSGTSHCNARAMARLYGGLACEGALNGKQLISADTLRVAQTEAIAGYDPVIGTEMRYSTGFEMSTKTATPMGPSGRAFGYVGAGGAFSFADPDTRLGFGYTPNFMHAGYGPGPCGLPLVEAANESVRKL